MNAPTSTPLDATALEFIRRKLGPGAVAEEVAGDASTRRFFRVWSPWDSLSTGQKRHTEPGDRLRASIDTRATAILMVHGEPLAPDAPLFTNHRILSSIGAPVPAILDRDDPHGLVLVEDFGDRTLQQHLIRNSGPGCGIDIEWRESEFLDLYRTACDLIGLMQEKAEGAMRPDDFAARNALDRERFLFELGHFDRHFIRGLRGLTPTASEARLLEAFYEELASACDRLPRVYCHRDFQSRNLMVGRVHRLGVIDFQDARMGPYTYDAASLLRDSSLDLEPALVARMLDHLTATIGKRLAVGPEEFRRDFDLMALQRNIKDLGTFGYMATVRGRRDYLEYVPRTQESIRRTMTASPRWHDPFEVFSRLALAPLT